MEVTKFILQNKKIRQYPIDNVVAVYIEGYSSEKKRPTDCLEKIWEELGGENPGLYLRQSLITRDSHYGFCPLSTKNDMPFRDGCKMFYRTDNSGKRKFYHLILLGKDNCKRLQVCAKRLGTLIGITSSGEDLESTSRDDALFYVEHALDEIKHML